MFDRRRNSTERRCGRRARFVAAVRQDVNGKTELALAQNLGSAGIELKRPAGQGYQPRTPVSLAFELPDGGELVEVEGTIVFERADHGFAKSGVRFSALSPLDEARIHRLLRRL